MALLVHGLILFPVWFPLQAVAGLIWAGAVPGGLGLHLLLADDQTLSTIERILLAIGLGYMSIVLGTLALQFLSGPLPLVHLLTFYDVLVLAFLVPLLLRASVHSQGTESPVKISNWQAKWLPLLVLLLAAAFFRFANLGYSEFQGDEVAVLDKARLVLKGHDDVLFLHKKGPAEILLATLTYVVGGRISEGVARLPFAAANLCGVVGLYALGQRVFSHRAGWWTALLVALNGFLVAFGRIAQYQNLVFLFSVLGLWCALRFGEQLDRRYLWLSALYLAGGLLAHSDAIFATAAATFVVLWAFITQRVSVSKAAHWLVAPVLTASVPLAAFYVPFVLHPHFQVAQEYLGGRTGQPPYSNFGHFLTIGTVYNAVYYLALIGVGLVWIAVTRLSRLSRPRWMLPVFLFELLVLSWQWPRLWHIGGPHIVGAIFLGLLLAVFLSSHESLAWRTALLWFGLPFLVYGFLFRDPRTHLYVLFPGASLLCGAELDRLTSRLKGKAWMLSGTVVTVLAVSTVYLYILFVSHTPEYKRTYPAHRIHFFWAPYGDIFPEQGLFGFPYRAGWKMVGYLYATGVLKGDYDSNEETHITGWYLRDLSVCNGPTRYYFLAENVQDERFIPMDEVKSSYELVGRIWSGDQVKIRMYERKPTQLTLDDYHVEEVVAVFDHQLSGLDGPDYPVGLSPLDPLAYVQHPAQLRLGSAIEFLGHSLDKTRAEPGDSLSLTLYWRALSPIQESYTVFTHVEDPGVVWGQMDGIPRCGSRPTSFWEVGYVNVDHYTIELNPTIASGPHPLVAGMYRTDTGDRLQITDIKGVSMGTTLNLGTINVALPEG